MRERETESVKKRVERREGCLVVGFFDEKAEFIKLKLEYKLRHNYLLEVVVIKRVGDFFLPSKNF